MKNRLIGIIVIVIGVFLLYKVTRPGAGKIIIDSETDRWIAIAFMGTGAYILFFRK